MKKCKKCEIEKDYEFFFRDKTKKDGYMNSCKDCKKKYELENKHLISENKKIYYSENKDKINSRSREYYSAKKDIILEKSKIYYEENKLEKIEYQKKYYSTHKDNISRYKSENKDSSNLKNRKRYKDDPLFRLRKIMSSIIGRSIRNRSWSKFSKTSDILGCSLEDFKIFIESQFKDGMSWDNHGEWHLDHKIPISWAENIEQIYNLNHYTNFQPMWAFENQPKNNKFASI